MEERLRPLNGLLALVTPHTLYPSVLRDAGFELAGLEVPVRTSTGNVVIDVLLYHPITNLLLTCEVKSGANVEHQQAVGYGSIDATALVQVAQVTVEHRTRPSVAALYACLEEHTDRIRRGLTEAGVEFPILALGPTQAVLHQAGPLPDALRGVPRTVLLAGPVPALIPFDHESDEATMRSAVKAELVAALGHRRGQVGLSWLTEQAAPQSAYYGRRAKAALSKRVGAVARGIAGEEPDTFAYVPPRGNEGEAVVRILQTPEDNDSRGRTQAYQALARSGGRRTRRSSRRDPDQLDLLSEVDTGDDDGSEQPWEGVEG